MKTWLTELKLCIVNEDIKKLETLLGTMPQTQDLNLLEEAKSLLYEGVKICQTKQDEIEQEMSKLKAVKKYLES